jgi:hypothetical protein
MKERQLAEMARAADKIKQRVGATAAGARDGSGARPGSGLRASQNSSLLNTLRPSKSPSIGGSLRAQAPGMG